MKIKEKKKQGRSSRKKKLGRRSKEEDVRQKK